LPRSSTVRSRPRARSGIRSSEACARTYDGRLRPILAVGRGTLENPLTLPADLNQAVMKLPPRRGRTGGK
jgi:hypothetical protein